MVMPGNDDPKLVLCRCDQVSGVGFSVAENSGQNDVGGSEALVHLNTVLVVSPDIFFSQLTPETANKKLIKYIIKSYYDDATNSKKVRWALSGSKRRAFSRRKNFFIPAVMPNPFQIKSVLS